jgi:hypothetical protein
MTALKPIALLLLAVVLGASSASASDTASFEALYRRAHQVCLQILLPNSMARPESFDLSAELDRLKAERDALALGFASPAGVEFLVAKSKQDTSREAQLCIVELLATLASHNLAPSP